MSQMHQNQWSEFVKINQSERNGATWGAPGHRNDPKWIIKMNGNEWNRQKWDIKMNVNGSKSPKMNGIIKNGGRTFVQNEANGSK